MLSSSFAFMLCLTFALFHTLNIFFLVHWDPTSRILDIDKNTQADADKPAYSYKPLFVISDLFFFFNFQMVSNAF